MSKNNSTSLQNNKFGSLERLENLMWNLKRNQKQFESYDQVIQEQLAEEVMEKDNDEASCGQWEFYLQHKAVISEDTEITKLWLVHDVSPSQSSRKLSLNCCLETGLALQNLL